MTNILSARKGQKNKESNFWRKITYCDQKHFGKDVFCPSLSPDYNKCRSLYVHRALNPLLPDQDQGKVSIPGTMVTWLLPDQDQGKVGWDQLRRGAHLGGRD